MAGALADDSKTGQEYCTWPGFKAGSGAVRDIGNQERQRAEPCRRISRELGEEGGETDSSAV